MDPLLSYTPAEAAVLLRTSEWWVREQATKRRVAHMRTGRGRVSFTAAQVEALAALATVEAAVQRPVPLVAVASLGATRRSRAAHRSKTARTGT
jgi:hypothetical protein